MSRNRNRVFPALFVLIGLTGTLCAQDWSKVRIHTIRAADNVFVLAGAGGNAAILTGEDGPLLIDTGYEQLARKMIAAAEAISERPVRLVINTHWHFDHVGGNEALAKTGAVIIAQENVRKRMSEDRQIAVIDVDVPSSSPAALPMVSFGDSLVLHWNDEQVRIIHIPTAHTDGDCIVYLPDADVLHMGDVWFRGMYPFIDVNAGGSIDGIINAFDLALTLANEETVLIPGHGPRPTLSDLKAYREMLVTVRDRVRTLKADGKNREEAIAARPTMEFDDKYGQSWLDPAAWIGLVYDTVD